MTRRSLSACACAAALLAAPGLPRLAAKPPDLPRNQKEVVVPSTPGPGDLLINVEEDDTAGPLFGLGVNSDAGAAGSITMPSLLPGDPAGPAPHGLRPNVRRTLASSLLLVVHPLVALMPPDAPLPEGPTCPYLKQQAAGRHGQTPADPDGTPGVAA